MSGSHAALSSQQSDRVSNKSSHEAARPPHDGPAPATQSCWHLNVSQTIYHLLVASGPELPRHSLSIQPKFASQHDCLVECIQAPGFNAMYWGSLPLNDEKGVECMRVDFRTSLNILSTYSFLQVSSDPFQSAKELTSRR